MIVYVSSPDLAGLHLGSPTPKCPGSMHFLRIGRPRRPRAGEVAGCLIAVAGRASFPRRPPSSKEATVVALDRGNVAVLIEIAWVSGTPIASSIIATAAPAGVTDPPLRRGPRFKRRAGHRLGADLAGYFGGDGCHRHRALRRRRGSWRADRSMPWRHPSTGGSWRSASRSWR